MSATLGHASGNLVAIEQAADRRKPRRLTHNERAMIEVARDDAVNRGVDRRARGPGTIIEAQYDDLATRKRGKQLGSNRGCELDFTSGEEP